MKKIVSVLLSLIMIFAMSAGASAIGNDLGLGTKALNKLLDSFRTALKNGDSSVSLKEYGLPDDSLTYMELYELLSYNTNDIGSFKLGKYNESYVTLDIYTDSGYLSSVSIKFDDQYVDSSGELNAEQLDADKKLVYDRYRAALSVAKRGMTDVEKALALYDYLLTITDYPQSQGLHGNEVYPDDSYKAYGLLRDGYSTCLAYAKLYAILLNESGVPAITVGSDTINHEWVMVCIDGEWYHCDPTWDDFSTDYGLTTFYDPNDDSYDIGAMTHEYFLKSDEEFIELEHPDWYVSYTVNPDRMTEAPVSGPSGKFDDMFFSDKNENFYCYTAMSCINGNWYFCDCKSNCIIRTRIDGEPEYIDIPNSDMEYLHYAFPYGNDLYVATDYSIYRMDTVSDKFDRIFAITPPADEDEEKYTVYSEMSVLYDEMKLTTAQFSYNDDEDSEEWFNDVQITSETFPMNELQTKAPVTPTEEKTISARRDSGDDNDDAGSNRLAAAEDIADHSPALPDAGDLLREEIRKTSTLYMTIGVVVLAVIVAAVIAAIIIHKKR